MAKAALVDQRTLGKLVVERLGKVAVPKPVAPHAKAFKAAHAAFEKQAKAADAARKARDLALAAIGKADVTLDDSLDALANKLVGASLGTRKNPFAGFSEHPPHKLKGLPVQTEVGEVHKLVAAIHEAQPPAEVKKALDTTTKNAAAVTDAIEALTAPQMAYDNARGARDALLVEWTKALDKLKVNAKAAWHDEPAKYAALLAPPERVQRPVKHRKPSKKKGPPGGEEKPDK